MLIAIDGILNADEVKTFRARLDNANWIDGGVTAGALARSQKTNQQLDDNDPVAMALSDEVVHKVSPHPLFISAALPSKIFPPRFNRYTGGGAYGAHVDSALMREPRGGSTLRSDLSATLFLSEPDEYDGGELEIEGAFGLQQVKLAAGDLILYPSSSLHRVAPVVRGARIAAFFWVQSHVSDEGARTLLFDLDQAIQGITPLAGPGDDNLLKLTAVYHNLLRRSVTN